ncbi:collagen binding domain-containing protein, partial [Gemmatimonadota bacterium]
MKHLRYLLMAALVAMPLTACDEDDGGTTAVVVTGTIAGTVSAEGQGLSGVSVTLVGASTQSATTGANGTYTFANVEAGSYGVAIDDSAYPEVAFGQTSKSTTITVQGDAPLVDFAGTFIRTASVQGLVIAGQSGVAGVTATLTGGPDSVTKNDQTNPGGEFSFTGLRAGTYTVVITQIPANYLFATTNNSVTISGVGETATTAFTGTELLPAKIMGVVLADGQPLGQVDVDLTGDATADALTDAAGAYVFDDLEPGTYTVTISGYDQDRYFFASPAQTVTVDYGDERVLNFGGDGNTASVSIERITNAAGVSVNRAAVAGMVIVQVGVDQGGENITDVHVELEGKEFGRQTFSRSVSGAQLGDDEEFEIDFPLNTAMVLSTNGMPVFPYTPEWYNGVNTLTAYATSADGDIVQASEDITLVNADLLALNVANTNPGGVDFLIEAASGLRWLSGSLTFTVTPIIFSAPYDPNSPPIARTNLMFSSFLSNETTGSDGAARAWPGQAVTTATFNTWTRQSTTPGSNGEFVFSFPDHIRGNGGSADLITGFIGVQDFGIQTITTYGQNGPGAICPNLSSSCVGTGGPIGTGGTVPANPLLVFFQGELQSGTGAVNNILRVDNQAPWINTIMLTSHTLWANHAGSIAANYPLLIDANGIDMVRGGMNLGDGYPGGTTATGQFLRDGWVNHTYAFGTGMWNNTAAAPNTPTDSPNTWPAASPFTTTWATLGVTGLAPLAGIGLATSGMEFYAVASDGTRPSALTVTGIGSNRQRMVEADGTEVETGADLPGEDCLGCDALPGKNTDEWDDITVAAVFPDLFMNAGISNVLEIGVDTKAPIYITTPTNPVAGGTKYNTYGTTDSRGVVKVDGGAGVFGSSNTDGGQGFSGVAGIEILDWENGCASPALQCAVTMNTRSGVQMQAAAFPIPPANTTLTWSWQLAASTFFNTLPGYAIIPAYDAVLATPAANDGYRQQQATAYDRADNGAQTAIVAEHIADKTVNNVGNVTMDPTPLFVLGQSYVWGGQATDVVDLDFSDFGFDFNWIRTIQTYMDPMTPGTNIPQPDVDGIAFVPVSLQLPLVNIDHTAWGSASIYLQDDMQENVEFLGCLVRFDETGYINRLNR